jgi:hypothetical protein
LPRRKKSQKPAVDLEQIVQLKNLLAGDDAVRHENYDTIIKATDGNYYDRISTTTAEKWQGILYDDRDDTRADHFRVKLTVNLLNPVIEAKRALWSVLPQIRCPYRDLEAESLINSDRLEQTYRYLWKKSRMGEVLGNAGFFCAQLGTTVLVVYPDFRAHRPKVVARSPYGFYGIPGDIEQSGTEWLKVFFVTKMPARQARAMYFKQRDEIPDSSALLDVIEYWDEDVKVTFIEQGLVQVSDVVVNKLGFVPVVTIPNIAKPGHWDGRDDVSDAIPIVSQLNKRFNMENHALSDMMGSPWEALGSDDGQVLTLDPDGINRFPVNGGLRKSQTNNLSYQIFQSNQQLREYIDSVTDFPEVMRSMFGGSIATGKGINALMGPLQARMELRGRYTYPRLEIINEMMIKLWKSYFGEESHVIMGSDKNGRFSYEINLDEFEGFYDNEVFLDSASYFDIQSRALVGLQMIQNNALSVKSYVEQLNPFVENATQELEQIKKEQMERIQLAMAGQMMMQGPMGQQPDLAAPTAENRALEQGNLGMLEPAPPPPGVDQDIGKGGLPTDMGEVGANIQTPWGPQTELEGAADQELMQIADLIRATPNVKGQVFLTGSILDGEIGPEGVEIHFTESLDWAPVRTWVFKQRPDLKGKFTPYYDGEPTVPYLEVTPGTSGYEPETPGGFGPPEMGSPQEGQMSAMPPGLGSMMGGGAMPPMGGGAMPPMGGGEF